MKKKKLGVILLIAVLLLGGLGAVFCIESKEIVTSFSFGEEVKVINGQSDIKEHSFPFALEESGNYVVNASWDAEKSGMISAVVLKNEADEVMFGVSGESVDAESLDLELESGEYTAQYFFFTNEMELEAWKEEIQAVEYDDTIYAYAENEIYNMMYHFSIARVRGTEYNVGILLGMLVGVGVSLLFVALLFKVMKVKKGSNFEYDERQQLARGCGFKYAYMVSLIYNGILCIVTVSGITLPIEQGVLIVFGIYLSILVYAVYCIKEEAYVSLNESANRVLVVFTILGGINFIIGILHCVHGTMIENGVVTYHCMNLLSGIFLLLVAGILFIHTKKQSGNEE